jgi:hypothetical protein
VLGFDYHNVTDEERAALVAVRPREDFASRILAASTDGIKDRRDTTLDNVKADVLEHFEPGFLRGDFVEVIKNSDWLE